MNTENQDEQFMRKALVEAQAAFDEGEIPVGAIVVCRGRIISRAHNLTETLTDVTAHAEMPWEANISPTARSTSPWNRVPCVPEPSDGHRYHASYTELQTKSEAITNSHLTYFIPKRQPSEECSKRNAVR